MVLFLLNFFVGMLMVHLANKQYDEDGTVDYILIILAIGNLGLAASDVIGWLM